MRNRPIVDICAYRPSVTIASQVLSLDIAQPAQLLEKRAIKSDARVVDQSGGTRGADDRNPMMVRKLPRPNRLQRRREQKTNREVAPPHSVTSSAKWLSTLPVGHLTRPLPRGGRYYPTAFLSRIALKAPLPNRRSRAAKRHAVGFGSRSTSTGVWFGSRGWSSSCLLPERPDLWRRTTSSEPRSRTSPAKLRRRQLTKDVRVPDFTERRAGLAPAIISTPGQRASRRRDTAGSWIRARAASRRPPRVR